jgi:hypothetical protein
LLCLRASEQAQRWFGYCRKLQSRPTAPARNPDKIPLKIIEVQSGSYLGEDDIERFEDIYGRSTPVERGVSVKPIAQ